MAQEIRYQRLAAALSDPQAALARWAERFGKSPLRTPLTGRITEISAVVDTLITALAEALPKIAPDGRVLASDLRPGSTSVRELEKATAFAGASMASWGVSGCDAAVAILCLRDLALEFASPSGAPGVGDDVAGSEAQELTRLFDWLGAVACEAFGSAKELAATEKLRDAIERLTPVVMTAPFVPAVFLIGSVDSMALDSIFSRLIMQIVRVGAPVAIVDCTSLEGADSPGVLEAWRRFIGHPQVVKKSQIAVCGLPPESEGLWAKLAAQVGASVRMMGQFLEASRFAIGESGYSLTTSATARRRE